MPVSAIRELYHECEGWRGFYQLFRVVLAHRWCVGERCDADRDGLGLFAFATLRWLAKYCLRRNSISVNLLA